MKGIPADRDLLDGYRPRAVRARSARKERKKPPVDDGLTDVQRYAKRCVDDFAFFCEYEVKIKNKDGDVVPFILNPIQRQIALEWCELLASGKPIREVCLKSRQVGYSTFVAAFHTWLLTQNPARNAMVLAQDDDATTTLYEMYELMLDEIDPVVRPKIKTKSRLRGYSLDNRSMLRVATAGTKQTAGKVGRSKTNQHLHLSELAFWAAAKKTLLGVRATVKKFGNRATIIIESTPNGATGEFHKIYKLAKEGKNGYRARFIPWWMIRWEYCVQPTPAQQDAWDAWRLTGRESERQRGGFHPDNNDQIAAYNLTCGQWIWWQTILWEEYDGDEEMMMQEHPSDDVTCFLSTGRPVFPPAHLTELEAHITDPARCDLTLDTDHVAADGLPMVKRVENPNGRFSIWEEPIVGAEYLMPGDICSGLASKRSDRSAVSILKSGTKLEKVACYLGQPDPAELGDIMALLGRYYWTACAAPEVTGGYGQATLRRLLELGYTNVYRQQTWDTVGRQWLRDKMGFDTSPSSRPLAISALKRLLRERRYITHDALELNELRAFVYNPTSNKEEASGEEHDDMTLSACIGARMHEDVGGRPMRPAEVHVAVPQEAWSRVVDFLEHPSDEKRRTVQEHLRDAGYYQNF